MSVHVAALLYTVYWKSFVPRVVNNILRIIFLPSPVISTVLHHIHINIERTKRDKDFKLKK